MCLAPHGDNLGSILKIFSSARCEAARSACASRPWLGRKYQACTGPSTDYGGPCLICSISKSLKWMPIILCQKSLRIYTSCTTKHYSPTADNAELLRFCNFPRDGRGGTTDGSGTSCPLYLELSSGRPVVTFTKLPSRSPIRLLAIR